MNENLEDLKQKAGQLSQNQSWDELIPVCTKIIDLEQKPHEKAHAYVQRGLVYFHKGDLDLAIADFNEALTRNPDDAEAYLKRGAAYLQKGNVNLAIADFNEALTRNPDDAEVYHLLGLAYDDKGDHDKAIANFTKVLELEPNNLFAYHNRGIAYINKDNYDKAIADFTKILDELDPDDAEAAKAHFFRGFAYSLRGLKDDLNPAIDDFNEALERKHDYAVAYLCRGFALIEQEKFLDAFKDFKKADAYKPVLKVEVPEIYVANQIAYIYKDSDKKDEDRAFELYFRLLEAISEIQKERFYRPRKGKEVAHYTSLHALKNLADKERFRLYNAAYMNDPEEGREFFEVMKKSGIEDVKKVFYEDEDPSYPSPAYISSFSKVDEQDEEKDKLFMWRTYGKHNGQEAAGACLIFKHEGTVFAKNSDAQIGAMQQLQSKLLTSAGDTRNPREKQPQEPDLYEIVYSDPGNNQRPSKALDELAESLKQVKEHVSKENGVDSKKKLKQLARDLLDTIRFLFKARHYREEGEVRVVQVRYYDEKNAMPEEDGIRVDTEQIPPRFYLETHENLQFSEVILGPQTRGVLEWKRWLIKQDIKADQSKIPYGKPYL